MQIKIQEEWLFQLREYFYSFYLYFLILSFFVNQWFTYIISGYYVDVIIDVI